MKVLVCGGRDYQDAKHVFGVLDAINSSQPIHWIINGGADGADRWAREWAAARDVGLSTFDPDWRGEGRSAGPRRNQRMLDEGAPDMVIAFPGGRGTADMARRAEAAGVRLVEYVNEPRKGWSPNGRDNVDWRGA